MPLQPWLKQHICAVRMQPSLGRSVAARPAGPLLGWGAWAGQQATAAPVRALAVCPRITAVVQAAQAPEASSDGAQEQRQQRQRQAKGRPKQGSEGSGTETPSKATDKQAAAPRPRTPRAGGSNRGASQLPRLSMSSGDEGSGWYEGEPAKSSPAQRSSQRVQGQQHDQQRSEGAPAARTTSPRPDRGRQQQGYQGQQQGRSTGRSWSRPGSRGSKESPIQLPQHFALSKMISDVKTIEELEHLVLHEGHRLNSVCISAAINMLPKILFPAMGARPMASRTANNRAQQPRHQLLQQQQQMMAIPEGPQGAVLRVKQLLQDLRPLLIIWAPYMQLRWAGLCASHAY